MVISAAPWRWSADSFSASNCSYCDTRALLLACRAPGAMLTHSSLRRNVRCRADACLSSSPMRQAQRIHGNLECARQLPRIGGVDGILQPALLGEKLLHVLVRHRLAEPSRDVLESGQQGTGWRDGRLDVLEDVLLRIELRL